MAAQLYIHIGFHKTASTTIQAFLARNAGSLPGHGVMYPDIGRAGGPGHVNLAWELVGDRRFSADRGTWSDVAARVDGAAASKVVVSSEDLSMLPPSRVHELGDRVARYCPIIVVYVRPQEILIQSVYAQHCRDGRTVLPFAEFLNDEQGDRRYRFAELLDPWSAVFGEDAIRVRVLEPSQLVGGSVLDDFIDAIDAPSQLLATLKPVADQNRSPDGAALETLRRLALLRRRSGTFDQRLFAHTVGASVVRAAHRVGGPRPRYMSSSTAAAFRDQYAEQNETVARRYLDRPDGGLFSPVAEALHAEDPASLGVDYLLSLLDQVIADCGK